MKSYLPIIFLSLLANVTSAQDATPKAAANPDKYPVPRVIVSTDFPPLDVIPVKGVKKGDPPEKCSDPDDVQSMVRFLLYASEFDVEGLVASAGTFANVARKQNIWDILNRYDAVDENLRRHDEAVSHGGEATIYHLAGPRWHMGRACGRHEDQAD